MTHRARTLDDRAGRRLAAAALALVAALAAPACSGGAAEAPADPAAGTAPRTGVTSTPVTAIERTDRVRASGTVAMNERRTARLGAIVEGVLVDIDVQPGDTVRADVPIALIHSHVVHDAWAAYFKAVAGQRSAVREVAFATNAEARAERFVRDKALSPQEAERAAADRVNAEQALAAARAEVTRAEEELHHYGITAAGDVNPESASQVPVSSPFPGVVIERLVSQGTAVTPGTPLLVVSDLSTVWVNAEVDEAHLAELGPGRPAEIAVAAYPGEVFLGTVEAVGDVINPATRRVTVRIAAPNPQRRLKPQMFATVALGAAAPRRVLVVPSKAVQQVEGEAVVFVRGGTGHYQKRVVALGTEADGLVEITSGVREGEAVVTSGAFLLKSALAAPGAE